MRRRKHTKVSTKTWFVPAVLTSVLAVAPSLVIVQPAHALSSASRTVLSSGLLPQRLSSVSAYWTEQRLANAKAPNPTRAAQPLQTWGSTSASATTTGSPGTVAPALPKGVVTPTIAREPIPLTTASVVRPYTNFPDKTNGKVFFTAARGGDYTCSGTAINSASKSVVWTAGHCVHAGDGGGDKSFHKNWVFIPAYSSSYKGQRPYGTWPASALATLTEWASNGNARQDMGAATVARVGGATLIEKVGGQGISWNFPRNQTWSSFGYPAGSPYSGNSQFQCPSAWRGDDYPKGIGPATLKIRCNMTGGSSGGGWLFRSSASGLAYLNGVNSYRYANTPDAMYGPYFGNETKDLYNYVSGGPPASK